MSGLLLPEEVAAYAGVHHRTVLAWRRQGRIEAIRTPGGRYRFTEEACRDAGIEVASHDDGHAGGRDAAGGPGAPAQSPRERAPCPYDTNDDGDCGRPLCSYCGREPMAGRDFDIDGQPWA